MPSEKIRSKEDTWSTNELKRALNKDEIRKEREKLRRERKEGKTDDINEYEEKERRHRRDDDEDRRRHRTDDSKRHRESKRELTEDEREAQRRERREKKEGKSSSKSDDKRRDDDRRRHRDEDEEERRERRHRDRDERHRDERHRDRDDRDREEERERRRREREEEREKRHKDKEERHRDREGKSDDKRRKHRDEDDDEKRRRHRDEDGDDRRRRHKDEDGDDRRRKHREEDGDDRRRRHREEDGDDRRRRHRDDEDEDRKRRHRKDEDDRERRRDRHKEDGDDDERERQRRERREKRETKEGGKSRHRDEDEDERRRRKEREREKEKEREKEREREKRKSAKPSSKKAKDAEEEENGYNDYEDDFEDYDDDFEDDEDEEPAAKGKDTEMDEVLKALDQENERLYQDSRTQQDSPREDRETRYNRYNNYDDQESDSEPARPVTRGLINFSGAKQRAMSRKAHSKTTKRAQDLLQMIELDVSTYDLFDLPPVKEYDLYIRSFGRTDTKQAYVQTNEDNIDRDIQTDEIDLRQKWTQHPPEDFTGCGRGDGEKDLDEEESAQQNKQQDLGRLSSFIQKAGQVISILLDEEKDQQRHEKAENRTNLALSEGYSQLTCLSILKGRYVEFAHFSPTQPNYLLTVYNKPSEISDSNPVDKKGIICVWNTNEPSYPQRILATESQPVCCCFSPYKTTLVFAGMVDGSVCAWDLREPPALHKSIHYDNTDHLIRYPTYNTAGITDVKDEKPKDKKEGLITASHKSPITTLTPIVSYTDSDSTDQEAHEDSAGGLTFQLVSCEELGVLKFWVVAEISSPDMAGSEVDLGLSPGGRIKLVLSSSIKLRNPLRNFREKADSKEQPALRSFQLQLSPGDLNHYYVGTEKGFVYHGLRFGTKAYPRMFTALKDAPVDILTIDFSPFCHPCFLATTGDGDVHLFSSKTDTALVTWPARLWGTTGVRCAKWSPSRPCVFYVLDDNSRLYTFDLLEGDSMPAKIETLSKDSRVTCLTFTSDGKHAGQRGRNPQMLICLESGVSQIHTISQEFREQQTLEDEFLPSYLARF